VRVHTYRFGAIYMARKILSIDIREDAISAVLFKSGLKGSNIEAHAYASVNGVENGLSDALNALLENIETEGATCIMSLPASQFFYRNLHVPFKDLKKIKQILPFELEPTLPLPVEDLLLDYFPVASPGDSPQTEIFVASIRRSRIEEYLALLSTQKIVPAVITVSGYSIALWLIQPPGELKNGLIIDIGIQSCTLFVVSLGHIALVRSFPAGPREPAERIQSICADIQRTLYAFDETNSLDFEPEAVLLTGNGSDDEALVPDISNRLGIPARRVDIVALNTQVSLKPQAVESWAPCRTDNAAAMVLAEANGLKGFNFRKGPFAPRNYWAENRRHLLKTGILAAIILMMGAANLLFDAYETKGKITRLDRQITDIFKTTFPDIKRIVDPLHQMRVKMDKNRKSNLFQVHPESDARVIDLLNEISKRIPDTVDVVFTRLVVGPGSLLVTGNTDTFNTVDDIKGRLSEISFFKTVKINSANIDRSDNRVRFKLKAEL
jgi:general secretion pathway protein L